MIAYLLMALLALLTLLLLARPWSSSATALRMRRREANVAAYRTRLAELEGDVAAGLIGADMAQTLRQELAARLLGDTGDEEDVQAALPPSRSWKRLLVCGVLIAGVATAGYYFTGSWRTQQLIELAQRDPEAAQAQAVRQMVEGLTQRLARNPDDAEGWGLLGRSRYVLQEFSAAAQAYAQANRLGGAQDAEWLIGEGESLALAREQPLTARPRELFEAALRVQPEAGKALWYAGLAALQAQDYRTAQRHWLALQRQELPDDMRTLLQARLTEIAAIVGDPAPQAVVAGLSLDIEVRVAPALAQRAADYPTLFVFAKAASGGPPMPLAVQRLHNPKLPLRVRLDDSMAMMPQLRLSQFERWTVTARLTRGGTVQAESGDLQGQVELDRAAAVRPLRLTIDRELP